MVSAAKWAMMCVSRNGPVYGCELNNIMTGVRLQDWKMQLTTISASKCGEGSHFVHTLGLHVIDYN